MANEGGVAWSRLAVEAFVVVASILLALAVDEWRTGLSDKGLEREYLERLSADLEANLEIISQQHASERSQLENAALAYPFVARGDWNGLDTASLVRASYFATPSATPNWVHDTFEELKSTGRMSLIRSSSLRAAVLAYHRFLETADYTYELMSTDYRDAVREHMDPELQIRLRADCVSRTSSCDVGVSSPGLTAYVDWLFRNEKLAQGLRRVIVQWTRGEEEYLPRAEERTRHLMALIEDELEG